MDIVEEIRKDRESGAKRLVSEYKAGLMSLARRFCRDPGDAEELVNRTFAAAAPGPSFSVFEGESWVRLDFHKDVEPGSALDFSGQGFQDAPAWKHGFLRAVGGHFEFEGLPGVEQRFYGVNLCGTANFPDHDLSTFQPFNLSTEGGGHIVPATLWASSLDGRPLASSSRILLVHLTDVQRDGASLPRRHAGAGRGRPNLL